MPMDLEDRLEYLMHKGDRQDVLKSMVRYRCLCENRGMTTEKIEKEFMSLVKRVMSSTSKKPKDD